MSTSVVDCLVVSHRSRSELAPMSTSEDLRVALSYSRSKKPLIFKFVARGRSRGVDIGFLSLYPKEREFLYPVRIKHIPKMCCSIHHSHTPLLDSLSRA